MKDIQVYTVEYWQEHMDELLDRVEQGEHIAVKDTSTGNQAVFVPLDDTLIKMYTELNNEAS